MWQRKGPTEIRIWGIDRFRHGSGVPDEGLPHQAGHPFQLENEFEIQTK
jgi:hypothetical protein